MMFKKKDYNNIKDRETFAQSICVMMVSQAIIKAMGVLYKLYLTNRNGFGDEGNAIANSGFQIISLFLVFFAIGIPTSISKIIAQTLSQKDFNKVHKVLKISSASSYSSLFLNLTLISLFERSPL